MTARERRLREYSRRHELILGTAREMAEAEGWDFVTTRRLADRIEYSQPVLYQHFKNKDAIVQAVALEGFGELVAALRTARLGADGGPGGTGALAAVARAYSGFAARGPVLYQAMLTLDAGLADGPDPRPGPLLEILEEIRQAVEPVAAGRDPRLLAEVVWSAWHGLAVLTRSGLLDPGAEEARLLAVTGMLATAQGALAS
jgi:AcrR family transcriptional regulator